MVTNVQAVDREYIDAALAQLEQVDVEAANALRNWIDAHYLLQDDPLEIRELLLRAEERAKGLAGRLRECAIEFERMACGTYEDQRG